MTNVSLCYSTLASDCAEKAAASVDRFAVYEWRDGPDWTVVYKNWVYKQKKQNTDFRPHICFIGTSHALRIKFGMEHAMFQAGKRFAEKMRNGTANEATTTTGEDLPAALPPELVLTQEHDFELFQVAGYAVRFHYDPAKVGNWPAGRHKVGEARAQIRMNLRAMLKKGCTHFVVGIGQWHLGWTSPPPISLSEFTGSHFSPKSQHPTQIFRKRLW